MRQQDLEKLLYKAVADALGVEMPAPKAANKTIALRRGRKPALTHRQDDRAAA